VRACDAEAAALLSTFVFEERIEAAAPRMTAKLAQVRLLCRSALRTHIRSFTSPRAGWQVCFDANALIRSLGVLQESND
jgi:hypothetical protein